MMNKLLQLILISTALLVPHSLAKDVSGETKTATEDLIYSGKIDQLLEKTDIDQVKQSHAAGLARVKGRLIHFRRELNKQALNPINRTTVAIVDNLQITVSQQLSKIQSPYYDTRALLKSQMNITEDPECMISRDMYRNVLSVHHHCPSGQVTYRLETDGEDWYLTGLKSNTLNDTFKALDNLIKTGAS